MEVGFRPWIRRGGHTAPPQSTPKWVCRAGRNRAFQGDIIALPRQFTSPRGLRLPLRRAQDGVPALFVGPCGLLSRRRRSRTAAWCVSDLGRPGAPPSAAGAHVRRLLSRVDLATARERPRRALWLRPTCPSQHVPLGPMNPANGPGHYDLDRPAATPRAARDVYVPAGQSCWQ